MAGFKTNPLPSPGIGRWSVDPDQLRYRRICREAIQQAPARSAFRWPEALKRVSCFIGLKAPCSLRMNRADGLLCYATVAAKAREEWGTRLCQTPALLNRVLPCLKIQTWATRLFWVNSS